MSPTMAVVQSLNRARGSSVRSLILVASIASLAWGASCSKNAKAPGEGRDAPSSPYDPPSPSDYLGDARSGGYDDARSEQDTAGYKLFEESVQPLIAQRCSSCHLGERFAFASLTRSGSEFSAEDTAKNYRTFVDLLSLDAPMHSRLLAKILPDDHPRATLHRGGPQVESEDDPLYQAIVAWAEAEKAVHCAECGTTARGAFVAYVKQPESFWMMDRHPDRTDRGSRTGARIMLQPVDPATATPGGDPIDFLAGASNGFCADGDCDFGRIASNHSGTALTFECRVSVAGEDGLDRSWNICIAGIGPDGRALSPTLLLPDGQRQAGLTMTRTDPFGVPAGLAAKGVFDKHYRSRNAHDLTPVFTPDDQRVVFAGQREDPDSGVLSVQTYHGEFFLDNLISVDLSGGNMKTVYRNEGGSADLPFFRRNGNIAFHTWNLERMDRHMYVQALADGMLEMPILGGRMQGPNMWGTAFETNNGNIIGMTGRRRGEMSDYAPFVFDHTLGISTTNVNFTEFSGFKMVPEGYIDEIGDYPDGYCPSGVRGEEAADTKNCFISKLIIEANYLPDGRALVAYNPEKTYISEGSHFYGTFTSGDNFQQRLESARPYLPKKLGIGVMDREGQVETLLPNQEGFMYRYPTWVGARQHPRRQVAPEPAATTDLHIADFPLWLSFEETGNTQGRKTDIVRILDRITKVRVMRKIGDSNACVFDSRYQRMTNVDSGGYHPSALGMIDATGYEQYIVPESAGGDEYGDIRLEDDRSVKLRVPAGELLLFQGVDDEGEVMGQHNRVMALVGGHTVDTSVRRQDYYNQCASCHGVVESGQSVDEMYYVENLPAEMSFDTLARGKPAVDLTLGSTRELSFRNLIRPLLDEKCVSCHSGESPAAGLSLQAEYSATGNYPASGWETDPATSEDYLEFMADRPKVPSYNFSVTFGWFLDDDYDEYKDVYAEQIENGIPLADVAPWDAGYQNLFRADDEVAWYYLSSATNRTAFGRASAVPSNAARSYLIEVLDDRDNDPSKDFDGSVDHSAILDEAELRTLMAVLDVGFPYTGRCDDREVAWGPNSGQPWGEPTSWIYTE